MTGTAASSWVDRILFGLWAVWCLTVISLDYFPSQEGPSDVYSAFLLANVDTAPYTSIYVPSWSFTPNQLGVVLLYAMGSALPLAMAEKLIVVISTTGIVL